MSDHIALLTAHNKWWLCRVSDNHKYSVLTPYSWTVDERSYRAADRLQRVAVFSRAPSQRLVLAQLFVGYSVLQCVAVCCSVLQRVAVCCSVLQCVTV